MLRGFSPDPQESSPSFDSQSTSARGGASNVRRPTFSYTRWKAGCPSRNSLFSSIKALLCYCITNTNWKLLMEFALR
jgi:hypothetical protein